MLSFIQNRDHLGRGLTVCVDVVFIKSLIWYAYSIKVMTRNVNEMLLQINQKRQVGYGTGSDIWRKTDRH